MALKWYLIVIWLDGLFNSTGSPHSAETCGPVKVAVQAETIQHDLFFYNVVLIINGKIIIFLSTLKMFLKMLKTLLLLVTNV